MAKFHYHMLLTADSPVDAESQTSDALDSIIWPPTNNLSAEATAHPHGDNNYDVTGEVVVEDADAVSYVLLEHLEPAVTERSGRRINVTGVERGDANTTIDCRVRADGLPDAQNHALDVFNGVGVTGLSRFDAEHVAVTVSVPNATVAKWLSDHAIEEAVHPQHGFDKFYLLDR